MNRWGIDGKGGTMARGSFGRYAELFGVIMSSEHLDELPEVSPVQTQISFFSRLMKSERLPFDEVSGGRPSSQTPGLLTAETLPLDDRPEPRGGRTSFIATLFSRESLPVDPVPGPGPVGRDPGR
jgi:hypothetical protein